MASYRGHLVFSSFLGSAYGTAAVLSGRHTDWGEAFLGAGLTTVGGLLPDLDSDSGVPVRELFGTAACIVPFLAHHRLLRAGFTTEQTLVLMAGLYVLIRYGLSAVFKRWTVHRGMFHSIPALAISGLAVYLLYGGPSRELRAFLAVGVMLGFLSHLVLDELYSVDFMGVRLRLNKYAGSALKLASRSWAATLVCYALLGGLLYLAWLDWNG
jgi:membrane-bound metal-dependent hydrolase YbcI (DUF457 family)